MLSSALNHRTSGRVVGGVFFKAISSGKFSRNFASIPDVFQRSDTFLHRHVMEDKKKIGEMLQTIGVSSVDELIEHVIPKSIRRSIKKTEHLPAKPQSESFTLAELQSLANQNVVAKNFIGQGYYGTLMPTVIQRNLFENPSWYTSYTPYQAEISQGRLETLLIFQTMATELTGMEVANASLLDEGSAAAEAMNMAHKNFKASENRNRFFVSNAIHPQVLTNVRTRAGPLGIEVVLGDATSFDFSDKTLCGALIGYPDTLGKVDPKLVKKVADELHANHKDATLAVSCDLLSLTLLTPPGQLGADIAFGSSQRFGVPMGNGGPHAAFFATKNVHVRRMPGRIIGVSKDVHGNRALRMALQTREQHIRKDKATSNICTAQALLANTAAAYAVYHGPEGLRAIANRCAAFAQVSADELKSAGYTVYSADNNIFDTVTVIATAGKSLDGAIKKAEAAGINVRVVRHGDNPALDKALKGKTSATKNGEISAVTIAYDETHTAEDIKTVVSLFSEATTIDSVASRLQAIASKAEANAIVPETIRRGELNYMKQNVFNRYHTETEMMRWLKRLERKDLSLTVAMIPLGSCTMKLNPASSLYPITWPQFANIHPFAPESQKKGFRAVADQLEGILGEVTGLPAVSLQPNSGATGEYAGLLAIKGYLDAKSKAEGTAVRNVCIIPSSAHGTNAASAAIAGLKIVAAPSDPKTGQIDLVAFKKVVEQHKDKLACAMITYPSTHGVFEPHIKELTAAIHAAGGQVYIDGANMNAQVGLTSPASVGGDVCHLNLHKTFSIPHGGGGPGVGPICAAEHLRPYLPTSNPELTANENETAVSAAGLGSALILPIPWMYCKMLGAEGLTTSTERAILNANYLRSRLAKSYDIKFSSPSQVGAGGSWCAHEFIMDFGALKTATGVTEEDVAKRLMDYGFHGPTMSWPVASSLMVEPSESEHKAELDRFVDALISIRKEVNENPSVVKNAPHTPEAAVRLGDDKITRLNGSADFTDHVKFWPSVGRIDNPFGDKNLVCACGDIDDYVN